MLTCNIRAYSGESAPPFRCPPWWSSMLSQHSISRTKSLYGFCLERLKVKLLFFIRGRGGSGMARPKKGHKSGRPGGAAGLPTQLPCCRAAYRPAATAPQKKKKSCSCWLRFYPLTHQLGIPNRWPGRPRTKARAARPVIPTYSSVLRRW